MQIPEEKLEHALRELAEKQRACGVREPKRLMQQIQAHGALSALKEQLRRHQVSENSVGAFAGGAGGVKKFWRAFYGRGGGLLPGGFAGSGLLRIGYQNKDAEMRRSGEKICEFVFMVRRATILTQDIWMRRTQLESCLPNMDTVLSMVAAHRALWARQRAACAKAAVRCLA